MSFKHDFAEIIYFDNEVRNIMCKNKSGLNTMINILRNNLTQSSILVLDLHNVTDLFEYTDIISTNTICVLSYVGRNGETRCTARNDIIRRILSLQVKMGILVFERPKLKTLNSSTDIEDVLGTKAWIIYHMYANLTKNTKFYFVDDSNDHVALTNKYNKKNVFSFLTDGTLSDAKKVIANIDSIISSS